jgi:SAM-dependent methyltransferase
VGAKFTRKKPKHVLNSIIYKLGKLKFAPDLVKFRLFADLEWIFAKLAHEYSVHLIDWVEHPMKMGLYNFLENKISDQHNLLDFGCATGIITHQLGKMCKSIEGVDYMPDRIEEARNDFSDDTIEYFCGDAIDYIKSSKKKFDVLICVNTLEHLDHPRQVLQEVKDYFSFICIEVPDFESSYLNASKKILGKGLNYTDEDHINEWDRDQLQELFANQGLKILDSEFRFGSQKYWLAV